ncbi:MAG TPA: AI-2E family transporter [Spirochaetota bacterium]|nr:AI-2E family transporter [Spirochaetota bacterium]HOM09406.1 AI-2E family transporter [Spirochaetota bacterium]HPP49285.1 AI-2E family transporter [Spirochaetota bacterium]
MIPRDSYKIVVQSKRLTTIFWVIFIGLIAGIAYIYRYYFWPFLFALIFYIGLKPLYTWILQYVKSRMLASFAMVGLIIVAILIPTFILLISLSDQVMEFYNFLQLQFDPKVFKQYLMHSKFLKETLKYFNITQDELFQRIVRYMQDMSLTLFSNLTGLLTFSIRFSINFFFMLLILFFLFKDSERFEKSIYTILPFPNDIEHDMVDTLKMVVRILLAGNFMIMMLQGLFVGIGFVIVGLSTPVLWGSIAAVFSLIPVIGTSFVWLPASLYLLAIGSPVKALIIALWCLGWYLLLENVLKPVVFGEKLNFHPLILFFLLLGSLQTFGLPGIIIGPILLTLFFSFWEMYKILDSYEAVSDNSAKTQKKK